MADITQLRAECVQELVREAKGECFMDDLLARCAFNGFNEGAEMLIRAALGRDDLQVVETTTQLELSSRDYRGLIIDIQARTPDGTRFNIEVQRTQNGAPPERGMFHMAMMASHTLPKGTKDFRLLPTIYVIFFNEHDELRNGRPLSKFVWYDTDNSEKLSDKQSIVYINGSLPQESPLLASVVHDMFCKEYTEMENQVLADRMKYLRTDEGEDEMLDYVYSKLYNHIQLERADAKREGKEEGKVSDARAMLADNMPHELVVKYTGLTMEQVEALSKELATA